MKRRTPGKVSLRRYLGAVWIDGASATIAVCVGPSEPERGRLVTLEECPVAELAERLGAIEVEARLRERAAVAWTTAVRGAECLVESCAVPREVESSPAETRAIACLAGTAWGDPDAAAAMHLALAYQLDGQRCLIAAAPETALVTLRELVADTNVRVTSEAVALAELVRCAHPAAARPGQSAALALLCEDSTASLVILEDGVPVVARQADLADRLRSAQRKARAAAHAADGFETGATSMVAVDFVPSLRDAPAEVSAAACHAAVVAEIHETLAQFRECGGFAGDVGTILVAGAAAERFELRAVLPRALGCDVDVFELEGSRTVSSTDVDLARRIAESEAGLAGIFALLAAGRRADLLAFPVDYDSPEVWNEPVVRRSARLGALVAPLAAIGLATAITLAAVGGRYAYVSAQADAAARAHETERRRAEELKKIAAEKAANEAMFAHTEQLVRGMESIRARQGAPARLLADVRQYLPAEAGLSQLSFDGTTVVVVGATENSADADAFALNLQNAGGAFADVSPATVSDRYTKAAVPEYGIGPEERPLERFSVRARYTPAAADPAEQKAVAK